MTTPDNGEPSERPSVLAQAIAAELEAAACSSWEMDDGTMIEIYVSQVEAVVSAVLLKHERGQI
jgi:hypothetical protein